MTVDYQSHEITLGTEEWVTVLLSDSTEITVKGNGEIFTDGGRQFHA